MNGKQLEFSDYLAILSIYLGVKNLTENEQQSDAQIKILKQNDIGAANDRQAAYLIKELDRKFEEQNAMLKEILEAVKK